MNEHQELMEKNPSIWEILNGYAITEITENPNQYPLSEKVRPEIPFPRIAKAEADATGKTEVACPETDLSIKELHDSNGLKTDNYVLEVVIPSLCPIYSANGVLLDSTSRNPLTRVFEHQFDTPEGKNYKGSIRESPSIKCYYLGSSNHTVPHITVGEQVLVYHNIGNDTYYWKELGRDNQLRRPEKYRFFVSDQASVVKGADTANKNADRPNDDNTWFFEFDTINKHILLSTAASDGETIRYFTKFNLKDNTFSLWDTRGNRFEIDSDAHRLYMRNQDQSVVDVHGEHINVWAKSSVSLEADTINLIGRIYYNETVGVESGYKASQVSKALHQQSYSGKGPALGSSSPMTGTGFKTVRINTEEDTEIKSKKDKIDAWKINNKTFQCIHEESRVIEAKSISEKANVVTYNFKNWTFVGVIVNMTYDTWTGTGKLIFTPVVYVDTIRAKNII